MSRALASARLATTLSNPNPRVGCIIASPDGLVLGQGHTQQAGGPHAEVMALRDASSRGASAVGATAYVTLEPCSHHGRTGPCCDALIAAGIRKVVASCEDPNPRVAGQGFARLRAAGVEVAVGPGAAQSRELNLGFFSRMVRKTPWVRMKIAASLDGQTALQNGMSQWITSPQARADGQIWRARACAVLTGSGTVLQDDPRLDVRLESVTRQPHLVVLDSEFRTPLTARLWDVDRQVWFYGAANAPERLAALQARGAHATVLPHAGAGVDLPALLNDLARREVNEVHVEAGQVLNGALLQAGLVDELLVYLAPTLLGLGRGMSCLGPLASLDQACRLEFNTIDTVGPDLRILARVAGRDLF